MTGVEIPRDRYGKPLIIPPGGGRPVPYYRASSFGDVLDDRSNLEKYLRRMAVKGVSQSPHLQLAVAATPLSEKGKLNALCDDGITAAGGGEKASIGTSLHALTEALDLGQPLDHVPAEYQADLAAYEAATEPFTHTAVEQFVVNDELGVAGTPDRISYHGEPLHFARGLTLPGFATRITDLKTGGHPNYLGHYAVQLAIYSRSQFYDPQTGERTPLRGTGERTPLRGNVDRDWGVIFHMPAGAGTCDLYAMDLAAGWEGALLAAELRQWRKRKYLSIGGYTANTEKEAA